MLLSQDFSKTLQSGIYYFDNKCLKDQPLNTEACLTLPKKIQNLYTLKCYDYSLSSYFPLILILSFIKKIIMILSSYNDINYM